MKADIKKKTSKRGQHGDNPESGNNNKAGKADSSPRPNNPAKNAEFTSPDKKNTKLKA